ncbi:NYN domain-containing protein [Rhodovulum adriaticum]|uniref:Zc3h12a-like ribonuclease protein n=1 Tax=Rhodovulum adriaticum TaxID=35804 RepID=A0A4R2NM55_RHOAD|nr:hypothetical protein [Rhodovulum adriaticum]MBK1635201.1 hypothetical protein [Rhodovulum adriaticum]TCP22314.1 Zc3h12a-like ribonuclease protein [Rhodovulum adriaticum]
MVVPFILLLISLAGAVASVLVWGPVPSLPLLFALACAVGALILLVLAPRKGRRDYIVVDGSNVMYWDAETPKLETVGHVVKALETRGLVPVIWFDANVGYLVSDRYMGVERLARALTVPSRQVFIAPKGTPADPLLLNGAAVLKARVVTNDRFRDWVADHPQVQQPGFLVPGQVVRGAVRLDLGA